MNRHRVQPRTEGRCPICATGLATGQGVYSCPSCEWTGVVEGAAPEGLALAARDISEGDDADGSDGHSSGHHTPPLP